MQKVTYNLALLIHTDVYPDNTEIVLQEFMPEVAMVKPLAVVQI
jgi:hypothetical protein